MPTYSYYCDKCNKDFELFFYIKDYKSQPKCEYCLSSKETYRLYTRDILSQAASVKKSDNELKTIGDLANRNRDKMSEDEKNYMYQKHNDYKENKVDKPLPKGMTRMSKGKKIKWT
jgi:putative FmdB family regulatory protein